MKISASLYSKKGKTIREVVQELDRFQIDYIHIDCNDDPTVFDDIALIREISSTPIDFHLIASNPENYYSSLIEHRIELVTVQHENLAKQLQFPDELKARVGIAFTNDTPVETFDMHNDSCQFILFMTTTPGKSGGTFDQETFKRIRTFRERYPSKRVHVDGGVNNEVSFILRNLGVYCAVSGSFLVTAVNMPSALLNLKSDVSETHFKIKDFMMMPNELPILNSGGELSIREILTAINDSRMGLTLIVDDRSQLVGVVTDGDVRRALLKHADNLSAVEAEELINRQPITVTNTATIQDMMAVIQGHDRPITFLPVIDNDRRLVGTISFNNLVRGEQ